MPFPKGFLWGSSTNAQQFEGGRNEGGVGVSIADIRLNQGMFANPNANFADFKVASNHYHHVEEDISLLGKMGFGIYRFSMAWTRIFPNGDEKHPNEEGLAFYDRILTQLEKYNIQPICTLYAYDMPANLSKNCKGFTEREIIEYFCRYVQTVATRFKGRIKYYVPFNEQNAAALGMTEYMTGYKPKDAVESFLGEHHGVLCWALATRIIHTCDPLAKVAGNNLGVTFYPATCNPKDVEACDEIRQSVYYDYGDIYCRKIYNHHFQNKFGIDVSNYIQNGDMDILTGAEPDFFSFTCYSSAIIQAKTEEQKGNQGAFSRLQNQYVDRNEWGWEIDPYAIKSMIKDYWHRYRMPILVLENGLAHRDGISPDGRIHDNYRIKYFRDYITRMREAVDEGVEMIGYCTWSAIDLYSTHEGFSKRYGLIYVDRENDYKRIPKDSFYWYRKCIASNGSDLSDITEADYKLD
ncbi:MAG: glycoside hydrolase family 1 protein [Treponema sp.]|nr:glycoside hydrolase family 1 protein [Treponema sp.]